MFDYLHKMKKKRKDAPDNIHHRVHIDDLARSIESLCKIRIANKWKKRYLLARRPHDVDNVLFFGFKSENERYAGRNCKLTVVLNTFYGVESGFVFDKEIHTLAVLCGESFVLQLAFLTHPMLEQWEMWIRSAHRHTMQFKMRIVSSDLSHTRSKFDDTDPNVRLHLHDGRFCITSGCPPRIRATWRIDQLRRFGLVGNKFLFETKPTDGADVFLFLCSQRIRLNEMFKLAAYLSNRQNAPSSSDMTTTKTVGRTTVTGQMLPTTSNLCTRHVSLPLSDNPDDGGRTALEPKNVRKIYQSADFAPRSPVVSDRGGRITCRCGGSVKTHLGSLLALVPSVGLVACPVHPGHAGPVWIAVADDADEVVESHQQSSPTPPPTYINQLFIDSLAHYYNFDAIFFPTRLFHHVVHYVPTKDDHQILMEQSRHADNYCVPFDPKTTTTTTTTPDDPAPSLRRHKSPPSFSPFNSLPRTLPNRRGRAMSTCGDAPSEMHHIIVPDRKGCARTWSTGGDGAGNRRCWRSRSMLVANSNDDVSADVASFRRRLLKKEAFLRAPADDRRRASTNAIRTGSGVEFNLMHPTKYGKTGSVPGGDLPSVVHARLIRTKANADKRDHIELDKVVKPNTSGVGYSQQQLLPSTTGRSPPLVLDASIVRGLVKPSMQDAGKFATIALNQHRIMQPIVEVDPPTTNNILTRSVSGSYAIYDGSDPNNKKDQEINNRLDTIDDPISSAMQRMQVMQRRRLTTAKAASHRQFGDDATATSSPLIANRQQHGSRLFRLSSGHFSRQASKEDDDDNTAVDYCALNIGGGNTPPVRKLTISTTTGAGAYIDELNRTDYAHIDPLTTLAAKDTSKQHRLDRSGQKHSASMQTLQRNFSFLNRMFTSSPSASRKASVIVNRSSNNHDHPHHHSLSSLASSTTRA